MDTWIEPVWPEARPRKVKTEAEDAGLVLPNKEWADLPEGLPWKVAQSWMCYVTVITK